MKEDMTMSENEDTKGSSAAGRLDSDKLKVLGSIAVDVAVEVGRTELTIKELLALNEGSVVELDRMAGDMLDILVNGTPIARGEVVMVGERFGIRFSEMVEPEKRIETI